jgi:hypothetical protein
MDIDESWQHGPDAASTNEPCTHDDREIQHTSDGRMVGVCLDCGDEAEVPK